MFPKAIDLAGRHIGPGYPCFVIAEAGVNHNGETVLAKRLIEAARLAGADAVKFQTFKTGQLVTPQAPKALYQQNQNDLTETQFAMLQRLELSEAAHRELFADCGEQGLLFLSSPFDEASADFLEALGVAAFKVPSGEITNLSFLAHLARKGKPLIVSTGMACLGEVEAAVRVIEKAGPAPYILLHCVSNYPADPKDSNLRAMQTMALAFGTSVGYSDHTPGNEVALAAVALGAAVIEKHFTLDRSLPGPDHKASLEPAELAALIRGIRLVESALGSGRKEPVASEANTAAVARKSLVAVGDIPAGATVTEAMLGLRRPGTGLPASLKPYLVGRVTRQSIPAGTVLTLDMVL